MDALLGVQNGKAAGRRVRGGGGGHQDSGNVHGVCHHLRSVAGFAAADMRGSEHNDPYRVEGGQVVTTSNRHGGVLGGITTGMPLVVRVAIKPTPSIAREQDSVSLSRMEDDKLAVRGRHDPCIVHRAAVVIESVTALVIADILSSKYGTDWLAK